MTLLVTNNGEGIALAALVNKTAPQDLKLKLFKNNYTPLEASVTADFTEADFTGYSEKSFVAANWVVTEGAPSNAAYAAQTFTSSANQTSQSVYGYYIVQVTSGKVIWAERFTDGPYPIVNNGDAITVTPVITFD